MSSEGSNPPDTTTPWDRLANHHAPTVWAVIGRASLPRPLAVEVNRLVWLRLADHIDEVGPSQVEGWLCQTAERECTRSALLWRIGPTRHEPTLDMP